MKRQQSKILTWRQSNHEKEQTNASYIERITILDNVKHEGTDMHEQCKSKRTPSDGRRTMPPKVPSKCEKKTPSYLKMCEKQNSKMLLLLLSRNRFRSYKSAGVAKAIKSSKKCSLNFCLINKLHIPQISSGITEASNATNFSKCQRWHATSPSQQKTPKFLQSQCSAFTCPRIHHPPGKRPTNCYNLPSPKTPVSAREGYRGLGTRCPKNRNKAWKLASHAYQKPGTNPN